MKRPTTKLIRELSERKLTLALAESMTCGLAAHQLSTAFGTSEVFRGSIVCYSPEMKCQSLGVKASLIKKYTAESQEVTDALCSGIRKHIKSEIYAAITGLASPGGSEGPGKPVGTVFYAVRYKNRFYREKKLFRGDPTVIRKKACEALYLMIVDIVKKKGK